VEEAEETWSIRRRGADDQRAAGRDRTLERLEEAARKVRQSGADRKWDELSRLLQNNAEMFDAQGHRRKLVIFTEHRDTLNYLQSRISTLLGRPEAVVTIHGGIGRRSAARPRSASPRTARSRC